MAYSIVDVQNAQAIKIRAYLDIARVLGYLSDQEWLELKGLTLCLGAHTVYSTYEWLDFVFPHLALGVKFPDIKAALLQEYPICQDENERLITGS